MTIATEASSVTYVGNGVTVSFAVPFPFSEEGDLVVTLTPSGDDAVVQTLNVDYTVSGEGGDSGTVVMGTAPANLASLLIERTLEILQEVDLRAQGSFSPEVHEGIADKLTQICQQIGRQVEDLASSVAVLQALDGDGTAALLLASPHTWAALQAFSAGITATGESPDGRAVTAQGVGAGEGVKGIAGVTDGGAGVTGYGNAASTYAYGIFGRGTGTGAGVVGIGDLVTARGTTDGEGGIFKGAAGAVGAYCSGGAGEVGVYGLGGANAGGVYGNGSGAGQIGVFGEGGANGNGVEGLGDGSGSGVKGIGGVTNGSGVTGYGDAAAAAAYGVFGRGVGTGAGVIGIGDLSTATGTPAGEGGIFVGTTGSNGVTARGGAGAGIGVKGTGGTTGIGVSGIGGSTSGVGGKFASGAAASAPLHLAPSAEPTGPNVVGDLYVTAAGVLKICTVAGTPGTWVSVGAQ